jgi:hypothetical protein
MLALAFALGVGLHLGREHGRIELELALDLDRLVGEQLRLLAPWPAGQRGRGGQPLQGPRATRRREQPAHAGVADRLLDRVHGGRRRPNPGGRGPLGVIVDTVALAPHPQSSMSLPGAVKPARRPPHLLKIQARTHAMVD